VIVRYVLIPLWLGAAVGSASALTVGAARGGVVLGRPVDVAVEVTPDPGKALADSCIAADVLTGDRPLSRVRVLPLPDVPGRTPLVRIQTAAIVDEPVVTITLSAGCAGKTTRSFTLLADPPDYAAPGRTLVAALPAAPAVAASAPVGVQAPVPRTAASTSAAKPPRRAAAPSASAQGDADQAAPKAPRKAQPRTKPVLAAAPEPRSRLVMEPLEDWLADDAAQPLPLRLSPDLSLPQESTTAQQRAQAQAQWKALNMTPEEVLQESARSAAQDQELALARGQAAQERETAVQLQQAMSERFPASVVYALAALVLAALAGAAWMLWRMRQLAQQARSDWEAALAREASAAPASQSAPASLAPLAPLAHAPAAHGPAAVPVSEEIHPTPSLFAELTGASALAPAHAADHVQGGASVELEPSEFGGAEAFAAPAGGKAAAAAPEPQLRINPEELFDLQQQAEFFVSVGEHGQAIGVMKQYIAANATTAPAAYLDLLRLYRSLSRVDDFNQLRAQFHQHFNAKVPEFAAFNRPGRALWSYTEELAQIEAVWSNESVLPLLDRLLFRHGSTPHERFDLEAYDDLLLLYAIARTTSPASRGAPPPRQRTTPQAPDAATPQAAAAAPAAAPQAVERKNDFDDSMLDFDSAWLREPPSQQDPLTEVPPESHVEPHMLIDFVLSEPAPMPENDLPPITQSELPPVPPTAAPGQGQVVGFGTHNELFEARHDPELHKKP
jgi:hypothetical protein